MRKNKFLKTFGFTSLAMLMGIAGTMAFAPLASTNAKEQPTTTSGLGLDPKNDPVIYTTESGLEIKFGGARTALGGGNEKNDFAVETLPSGALAGYPYFTMGTYNGYAVNWVIIGKSTTGIPTTSTSTGMSDYDYEKLSTWQGKTSESPTYKTWFENYFETYSPAGSLIENHGVLNDYAARKTEYMFNLSIWSSIVPNDEIPNGCVLAFSEYVMGTCAGNHTYTNTTLKTNMDAMPTTLGISEDQMKLVQTVDVYCTNNNYNNTWITCTGLQFFPLPCISTSEDFYIYNYLDKTLAIGYDISTKAATSYYSMSGCGSYSWDWGGYIINTSGGVTNVRSNVVSGIRPACVLKI